MNFLELSKKRFSARSYKATTVENEKLNYILQCAQRAPSAVNRQPWRFVVVGSDEAKLKLQECYAREWFTQAPLYIIVCVDNSEAWTRKFDNKNHASIDGAIATEHLCLAAADMGLGSCWVCNFDVDKINHLFGFDSHCEPIAIVPIGYIDEMPKNESARKNLTDFVSYL